MSPKERALFLREARPYAAEVLDLYLALLEVWDQGATPALVVKAVEASGPEVLAKALREGGFEPAERFMRRVCREFTRVATTDSRHCPECGGLPQLSIRSVGEDPLMRGQRQLRCSQCDTCWAYSASSCPACGESEGAKRTFYADADDPASALRVEACATCHKYLIDIDLARDPRAVPEVDELTALPLDLFAVEQGLSKITPNLMGF